MSRRIIVVGLAALCVIAMSAIAAVGASAAETTAYTCIHTAPGSGEFKNSHCNPLAPNESETNDWRHQPIANGETTQLTLAALNTQKLEAEIGGAAVNLAATGVDCEGCHFTNSGTAGAMKVSGEGGALTYTGVTVEGLTTKCQVAGGMVTTEPLKVETTGTAEAVIQPVTGTTLAKFEIAAIGAEKCNVKGAYVVAGKVGVSVAGSTATSLATKASGTLTVNSNKAGLSGIGTAKGGFTPTAENPNPVHNPISLT